MDLIYKGKGKKRKAYYPTCKRDKLEKLLLIKNICEWELEYEQWKDNSTEDNRFYQEQLFSIELVLPFFESDTHENMVYMPYFHYTVTRALLSNWQTRKN